MKHTLLFTGHMIDAPTRDSQRFPAAKEAKAREAIKKELQEEKTQHHDELRGIAGAASGGDILFQELCREMNIPGMIYLALPPEEYKEASVAFAGEQWVNRFEKLIKTLPVEIQQGSNENKDDVWVKSNLWMLNKALENGGAHMTLIALWNGEGGDGKGGTEHMVNVAKEQGSKTRIIDITKL